MTYQLAVLGNPVAHSLSPQIHEQFAIQAGLDVHYEKTLVTEQDFSGVVTDFFEAGGKGLNITVPHKHLAYRLAHEVSREAETAEAVNTLFLTESNKIRGENTDGFGLLTDMSVSLGWTLQGARILILGAGGAVQGVVSQLLDAGPAELVIANRTFARAESIVSRYESNQLKAAPLDQLSDCGAFDVIISGSSAGLAETNLKAAGYLPESLKHEGTCCYDMIYGKQTAFLNWAATQPAGHSADGLGMLVSQAAKSFELWFGVNIKTKPVLEMLRTQLANSETR